MKIVYIGPSESVEIREDDGTVHVVEVNTPTDLPSDIAEALLEQPDVWVTSRSRKRASRPKAEPANDEPLTPTDDDPDDTLDDEDDAPLAGDEPPSLDPDLGDPAEPKE